MNWVTLVLLAVIGLLTYFAYRTGFVRELVSLSTVILAVPIAGIFYDDMYPKVHPIIDNEPLANLVSFLAIFVGVLIAGHVGAFLLSGVVSILNLGAIDHALGAVFGLLKGIVLCQVLLIALIAFPNPDIRSDIDRSPFAERLLDAAPAVLSILPARFDAALDSFRGVARSIDDRIPGQATPTPDPGGGG